MRLCAANPPIPTPSAIPNFFTLLLRRSLFLRMRLVLPIRRHRFLKQARRWRQRSRDRICPSLNRFPNALIHRPARGDQRHVRQYLADRPHQRRRPRTSAATLKIAAPASARARKSVCSLTIVMIAGMSVIRATSARMSFPVGAFITTPAAPCSSAYPASAQTRLPVVKPPPTAAPA